MPPKAKATPTTTVTSVTTAVKPKAPTASQISQVKSAVKSKAKAAATPPYIIIDEKGEKGMQPNLIEMKWSAYPALMYSGSMLFLRLVDVPIHSKLSSDWHGKIDHKFVFVLNESQQAIIKSIEKTVLEQCKDKILRGKALTENVLSNKFSSNLDGEYMKVKVSCHKTAFHAKDSTHIVWTEEHLVPEINELFVEGAVCEYVCLHPNVIWIQDNMNMGLSWDLKSIKFSHLGEEAQSTKNENNFDKMDTADIDDETNPEDYPTLF